MKRRAVEMCVREDARGNKIQTARCNVNPRNIRARHFRRNERNANANITLSYFCAIFNYFDLSGDDAVRLIATYKLYRLLNESN